jgi:hypothetical protein
MPLTVNVGLSRKASENYQSTGVSINVSAELDQSLLARPIELQQAIDQLYGQAQTALDRQAGGAHQEPAKPAANGVAGANGHAPAANGRSNGQTAPAAAAMTASQSRAINAITRRLGIDAAAECQEILGLDLSKLNIRQASEFIDRLKALTPTQGAPAGNGGH